MRDSLLSRITNVSPAVVVLGVATAVVLAVTGGGYASRGGFWSPRVDARVYDEDGPERGGRDSAERRRGRAPFAGEVYTTAERLREVTALALVVSLRAAGAGINQRPARNIAELLAGVRESGLMPPGLEVAENGTTVVSAGGTHHVRYRPSPLGVEVVSVPHDAKGGPVLMIRIPDEEPAEGSAAPLRYYASLRLEGVTLPAPFAPVSEVIATGWKSENYKLAPPSALELAGPPSAPHAAR